MGEEVFTKQMRKATREIHAVSDALVNAKLAFALSDSTVWAEGLLVFYEIFRFLEEAMERLKNSPVGELCVDGMQRTEAFRRDLDFYLGSDWTKDYKPRESVVKYLLYLKNLEKNDPNLLMAYIYHLYMGLLSGGQILRKKRAALSKLTLFSSQETYGDSVTNFGDRSIFNIKKELSDAMNNVASGLDEETKRKLIEESKTVFVMNNGIIKSVQGTNVVILKKLLTIMIILTFTVSVYYMSM